eukprot:GEMP01024615.1.p1 GENE.GEMP01024615.1~~GEMP01024615.1.p1  ORF type:complete len:614 (+),score=190.04 GEMP01024615.1:75-1916(+)
MGVVNTLNAVEGNAADNVAIKTALVSVYDKADIEVLANMFVQRKVHVLSTGGTAKKLRDLGCTVQDVAEYTGSPEILDGRVKSLHPKIHGSLLASRGNAKHEAEMLEHGIRPIDLVVGNLYPFNQAVASGGDFAHCIENIDIGGPCMIRAAAKNNTGVCIVTSPAQYEELCAEVAAHDGATAYAFRRRCAAKAFALTAAYDAAISQYFADQLEEALPTAVVSFEEHRKLKYGCNPQQLPAAICSLNHGKLPFQILNGTPGYINLLDAINAWQLVKELQEATNLPASASFKHVSPAGAALGVPLSEAEIQVYEVVGKELSLAAMAYVRARNADPLCSFGDFVALSCEVDESCANILKIEVSDGIIAPAYTPAALDILKQKKKGGFVILQADPAFVPPTTEYRSIYGMGFVQKRNEALFDASKLENVVTEVKDLSADVRNDLILASISIKYTQSNSVGYAKNGMMVGVGAGQQSRVDCVKLAGRKVATWYLRFHPKVMGLRFKDGVKRQERVNARVRYIEGDFTPQERPLWEALFNTVPEALTDEEKNSYLAKLSDVSVSSDAFFPFRDSIDHCSKLGVKYVAQPGGSVADAEVIGACNEYNMAMAFTNLRLFHH